MGPLPASLQRRDGAASIHEDVAPYREATMEERSRMVSDLCRLAVEQAGGRTDVYAWQDACSPESEALWLRLVREARHGNAVGGPGRPPPR
ncbi:MAG TPA: hypothetical protein VMB50_13470 [Myxococcales bacterium]|nr:hypothetical protein [Myxococcales bacterium]